MCFVISYFTNICNFLLSTLLTHSRRACVGGTDRDGHVSVIMLTLFQAEASGRNMYTRSESQLVYQNYFTIK